MTQQRQTQDVNAQIDAQSDQTAATESAAAASRAAVEQTKERIQNPNFFEEVRDVDAESALFQELESEFGEIFSKAQAVGVRSSDHEQNRRLLNPVVANQLIAEHNPGTLAKQDDYVLAVMRGDGNPDAKTFREPFTSAERRVVKNAMTQLLTNIQSLAMEGEGLDKVTTATTETRTTERSAEEENGWKSRAKELVR